MLNDRDAAQVASALSYYGLDLARYSPTLVELFVDQWGSEGLHQRPEARAALVGAFSIGETTFMRHPQHFAALQTLLPTLSSVQDRPLRALSAGCASGEEAYSLAALLQRQCPGGFEIEGWDLNPRAIGRAREGLYRPWSLRDVDPMMVADWLEPAPCGVRVRADLRDNVRFEVRNLHSDPLPQPLDIVFCRNVLLYFRRDAAMQVLQRLAGALRIGGALFLGPYDPEPDPALPLRRFEFGEARYYLRTEVAPANRVLPRVDEPTVDRVKAAPRAGCKPSRPERLRMELEGVRLLSNQRRSDEALQWLSRLEGEHPLNVTVHVLTALVAEDMGERKLMLAAARRACFLAPEEPAPNYFLSMAFRRNGELRRASLHRRLASSQLRSGRYERGVPYSEGLTAAQLKRMIRGHQY